MVRRIVENEDSLHVNKNVQDVMDDIASALKSEGITVKDVNYGNKTIYVQSYSEVEHACYVLKRDWMFARQLGIRVSHNIGVPTLDTVDPIDAMITEAYNGTLPKIKTISKDVGSVYDYVIRDLLKMSYISKSYDETYWAATNNSKQVIIAVSPEDSEPSFYIFTNIDKDVQDDLITVLSSNGANSMWDSFCDDYNAKKLSFWDYIDTAQ